MALEAGELPSKSTDETERHRVRAGVHIGGEGSAVLVTRKTSGEGTRHVGGFFGLGNRVKFYCACYEQHRRECWRCSLRSRPVAR